MSNLLQDAAAWLADRLKESAGREVIYVRGASQSEPIVGTPAQQQYDVFGDDGVGTTVLAYDWTFERADLAIDGAAINPRPGDRITETLNGASVAFEVMPLGKRPCYEWLDTSGILVLVHTKKVL